MINIVIPMAGLGSRFALADYIKPKPFIDVDGLPMIVRVIENLKMDDVRFILIARKEHLEIENKLVKEIEKNYNAIFVGIDKLTEGTLCSVLFARKYFNNSNPLLIANSDQLVDVDIKEFISDCVKRNLDGSILTFSDKELNSKWSFARIANDGLVTEVKEKDPISSFATVGIYLFMNGANFYDAAIEMILNNDRTNNEFYTCPVYNYLIGNNDRIGIFNIDPNCMHGLGTPEDLKKYLINIKNERD
jgi:NDP-sugar pyrophosphorylase family protein